MDGRTLEWLTSSPPAPYNFAVLPQVQDIDAFYDMKARGVAYRKPDRYHDIYMPKNSGAAAVLAVFAFLFGFAMVWHIWWLVIACAVGMWSVIIARASNDAAEHCLPAADVAQIEARRYQTLEACAGAQATSGRFLVNRPILERVT